jgi:hypothetical protein
MDHFDLSNSIFYFCLKWLWRTRRFSSISYIVAEKNKIHYLAKKRQEKNFRNKKTWGAIWKKCVVCCYSFCLSVDVFWGWMISLFVFCCSMPARIENYKSWNDLFICFLAGKHCFIDFNVSCLDCFRMNLFGEHSELWWRGFSSDF